jgi:hypothetical protein
MKKNKILLLSDDLRMFSGIATMSREIVLGTLHQYDWCQIAGAIKHPDAGKVVDMTSACKQHNGRDDNYLKLYPVNGYGDENILFQIMEIEKPDAILHFTDPRFWQWLYHIEHQIRQRIPLTYLNIWDALPYPMWNKPAYKSCDALFAISKQTHNINTWILNPENCTTISGDLTKEGELQDASQK